VILGGVLRSESAFLADLTSALESHDLRSLTLGVAAALERYWPLATAELAAPDEAQDALACVHVVARGGPLSELTRPRQNALSSLLDAPEVIRLPGGGGLSTAAELVRARSAGASHVLFLPAHHRGELIGQAAIALVDPGDPPTGDLLRAMAGILSAGLAKVALVNRLARVSRRAYRENRHLRLDLRQSVASTKLIGSAPALRQAIAAADAVAGYTTPVLLRGESGTGKELLASHIHERSTRRNHAFVRINCGAIPDGLIEAELFGHERGAFTGADRRRAGVFERAGGGTVLLDEVAELPLDAQVKLLRVLQSGEYRPVGAEDARVADVRVIAATHRDLEQMVAGGTFRADLFFRLSVFPIVLPPLRERVEDIAVLASTLLQRIAARLGRSPVPALGPEALVQLESHAWPGNVRELENVLERALILSHGSALVIPALAPPIEAPARIESARRSESLAAFTRRHLEATLRACGGKIYGPGGAAARLGLPPSTLQSKMRRLGVRR
jgi:transcriptional regulator with GAF, ATPase, and Fis domain